MKLWQWNISGEDLRNFKIPPNFEQMPVVQGKVFI